jgi:hypothetical protein
MHDLSIFKLAPAGYSVHDLARIGASKKKLLWLVENKIFDLRDVPVDEIDLSDIQLNQVPVRKRGKPIVDHDGIQGELEGLQFPLYFLDYEAFLPAIPLLSGYGRFEFLASGHRLTTNRADGICDRSTCAWRPRAGRPVRSLLTAPVDLAKKSKMTTMTIVVLFAMRCGP